MTQAWADRASSLTLRTNCAAGLNCPQLTAFCMARFYVNQDYASSSLRLTFPSTPAGYCSGSSCNGYLGSLPAIYNNTISSLQVCMGGAQPRT